MEDVKDLKVVLKIRESGRKEGRKEEARCGGTMLLASGAPAASSGRSNN